MKLPCSKKEVVASIHQKSVSFSCFSFAILCLNRKQIWHKVLICIQAKNTGSLKNNNYKPVSNLSTFLYCQKNTKKVSSWIIPRCFMRKCNSYTSVLIINQQCTQLTDANQCVSDKNKTSSTWIRKRSENKVMGMFRMNQHGQTLTIHRLQQEDPVMWNLTLH